MRKQLLIVLLLLLPLQCLAEVKIINIKHRPAAELAERVRGLLETGEKVEAAGSHLIVIADGESLLAAEKMIALLDQPLNNLSIRVRQVTTRQTAGSSAGTVIHYGNTGQSNLAVGGGVQLGNSGSVQEQSLQLTEGGEGLISIGREVPFTEEWAAVTGNETGYGEKIAYRTITTGFRISPVAILGSKVLVDVEPFIASADQNFSGSAPQIDFSQLRTRLQVPFGRWYPLGQQMQLRDEISRSIVRWRSNGGQAEQQIQIRIDQLE